ncbi:MAG: gas vesicle protein GvpD P-loop domain-containing protein [Candidatus Nitrosocaldus sp.]
MMELKVRDAFEQIFKPFMDIDPVALLIRGLPGAGKTTLALELMRSVRDRYNCFYISTRVSYNKLRKQLPWVEDMLDDSTALQFMPGHAAISKNGDTNKIDSIDLRLSSADNLLNFVVDKLINSRRAFLVLDSWDALAKEIPMDERLKMEKSMLAVADANDGMLVFISEEPEMNTLAYLVDAVITLDKDESNNVWMRTMKIDKMRGVAIRKNKFIYTLHGGHFTMVENKKKVSYVPSLFPPLASKHGYVSTGSRDMDDALGDGIREGSVVVLEVDNNVNMQYARIIMLNAVLNNIRSNKQAMVICGEDEPLVKVLRKIVPHCTSYDLNRLMVFTSPSHMQEQEYATAYRELSTYDKNSMNEGMVMNLTDDPEENFALLVDSYIKLKEEGKSMVIYANMIWNELDEVKDRLVYSAKVVRNNRDVLMITVKSRTELADAANMLADVHIKLMNENDTHILSIVKPEERVYAVILDDNGYPSYSLLPLL